MQVHFSIKNFFRHYRTKNLCHSVQLRYTERQWLIFRHAVYGTGMLHLKTDTATAIGYFELAAKQGHSYEEYQLGRIYCFGLGVPRNLEAGMEWLRSSADHSNVHAGTLLSHVQQSIHNIVLNAASDLLWSLARMLQASREQNFTKRLRADRKQISKTAEKKQAHGLHHQEEYQGQTIG